MKLAIIGDLHISTRWVGNIPVIKQSVDLAKRLVEYCKSNDIHYLAIAGDIVDKAIDRSEIIHTVNKVFKIFSDYFYFVYYILGQHDCCVSMANVVDISDTIVTILDYKNVWYVDGKYVNLGKSKIGFANYSRNPRYRFGDYMDLYITHFTISNRFGQKIDNTKFGMMIAGDIHHKVDIGNLHSIGSFQQQSISKDDEGCNIVVYDCDTKEFSRVDIGGSLILRSSEIYSGLVDGVWYELKRKPKGSQIPIVDKFATESHAAIISKVREFMIDKNLSGINTEIESQLTDLNNFSTEFQIKSLKIHNFLKISDFEVNFDLGDKVLLSGHNGSGKSTFLNALFAALTGNLTWSKYIGKFDSEVYTILIIVYGNSEYELRRGSGLQYLKCNGIEVNYKNRNDFGGSVVSHLPFIPDVGILFQRPDVGTLFAHVNSNRKLELVSKVYHLEYLDQLYDTGNKARDKYKSKMNELMHELKVSEAREIDLGTQLSNLGDVSNLNLGELTILINRLTKQQSDANIYNELKSSFNKLTGELEGLNKLYEEYKLKLDSLDKNKYEINKTELTKLESDEKEYKENKLEVDRLTSEISTLDSDLSKLLSNVCPRCGQLLSSEKSSLEITEVSHKIDRLKSEKLTKLGILGLIKLDSNRIAELRKLVSEYESDNDSYNKLLSSCKVKIDSLNSKLSELKIPEEVTFTEDDLNLLMETKSSLDNLSRYNELKSQLNEVNESKSRTQSDILLLEVHIQELSLYLWYVCKSGPIYKDILDSLCESWSNDIVKFSTFEGIYRGNSYLDIKISFLKGSNWQDYSESSSGEQSYMDILFIKSVTANAGFIILDEFLRHMDNKLTERSIDEIKSMTPNLFILSSFNENLYFANKYIKAEYIPSNDECKLIVS